jgi:hypothetical protein
MLEQSKYNRAAPTIGICDLDMYQTLFLWINTCEIPIVSPYIYIMI